MERLLVEPEASNYIYATQSETDGHNYNNYSHNTPYDWFLVNISIIIFFFLQMLSSDLLSVIYEKKEEKKNIDCMCKYKLHTLNEGNWGK